MVKDCPLACDGRQNGKGKYGNQKGKGKGKSYGGKSKGYGWQPSYIPTSRAKARRGMVSRARAMASALGIPRHLELLQRRALQGSMD